MNYFVMKARTIEGQWYYFSVVDNPTIFKENQIALLNKSNSPILLLDTLRRCSDVDKLAEGDIVSVNNVDYLVCYERGFYLISNDYRCLSLAEIKGNYVYIGDILEKPMSVNVALRNKVLFKYKDSVFRIEDICGSYQGRLILRGEKYPVPIQEVRQECCITYRGARVFLGDTFEDGTIKMINGRICLVNGDSALDITTGGKS